MRRYPCIIYSAVFFLLFVSCNSGFTPKPKGYFKIDFPKRSYQLFTEPGFPYSFEYPAYATVSKNVEAENSQPYWLNVEFKGFNGRIYLSYKEINGYSIYKVKQGETYRDSLVKNSFEKLRDEAFSLTYKHTVKASGIVDSFFSPTPGYAGMYFYVEGNAATSKQFFVTDSTHHFLRGALYFDATPNEDSIKVVSDFLEADVKHLISTLRWK
jgi:gliding motility-associated lipoprotein GldD